MLISFIREAWALAKTKRAERIERGEKAAIAAAFNNRYTYRKRWTDPGDDLPGVGAFGMRIRRGYAWMCPECNRIHEPTECSAFSGLQYPKCCTTPEGHRLYDDIRTQ